MSARWHTAWILFALLVPHSVGCEFNFESASGPDPTSTKSPTASSSSGASRGIPSQPAAARPADSIRVASYNIQVFGQSKLEKEQAMQVLAEVARQFDIVAIQEVRSSRQDVLPRFVSRINQDGSRYDFVIGPRQGRTSSKEQYAFVYDTTRIELVDTPAIVPDPEDWLHREPMVATFRARGLPANEAFTFRLVNIHTDPDETDLELDALAEVFRSVQSATPYEDDVILLGDLNEPPTRYGKLSELPSITWAVRDQTTNTRRSKSYDNLLFHRDATAEYTGRWGVFDVESAFGLSRDETLEVSDHLPVWAEFDSRENMSRLATRP